MKILHSENEALLWNSVTVTFVIVTVFVVEITSNPEKWNQEILWRMVL